VVRLLIADRSILPRFCLSKRANSAFRFLYFDSSYPVWATKSCAIVVVF
jgi:hypothetical protein